MFLKFWRQENIFNTFDRLFDVEYSLIYYKSGENKLKDCPTKLDY